MTVPSWKVYVFQESPVFDQYARWFQIPGYILDELYVTAYEIVNKDDPQDVGPWSVKAHLKELRDLHPSCVLIY